jgi:5S rRNA maturation endonuclease (ribonuclease M5)
LKDAGKFPFRKFNVFFRRLPDPFNIIYASPVAALLAREEFETIPKIRSRINARQSMVVLRNRLFQLKKDAIRYQAFTTSVSYVLSDGNDPVAFAIEADETNDVDLPVRVRVGSQDAFKDISLLGSGTLQIIEIMLALHAERSDLNIILLDEPDSHIHRDIQRRLSRKLTEHTGNTQVFLTTHNESLIRSTRPEHIFHLEPRAEKTYTAVLQEKAPGQKKGLQPSRYLKILKSLGSETSIDFLNALEAERLVLVEGEDDARFIQAIVERSTSPATSFSAMYWSFDGVDGVFKHIGAYRDILQQFRNDKTLWEKAVLVIDRDHLMDTQRTAIMKGLSEKLNIPVYISTSYTMEATVLSDVGKFKVLLTQLIQTEHGHAVDAVRIGGFVDDSMKTLRDKLTARIADIEFVKGLFNRLKTRREKLEALGIKKAISTYDGGLQVEYLKFANDALTQDKLHLLADKDDVAEVVKEVHLALSIPFNADFLFERLIDAATPSTWFDEWKELRIAVK